MHRGVDSIAHPAHAYANPAHEKRIGEIIRDCGFKGSRALASHLQQPRIQADLHNRGRRLRARAHVALPAAAQLAAPATSASRARAWIARSGSGSMTFAEAEERPFETMMSGPVAGAQGASELARLLDVRR